MFFNDLQTSLLESLKARVRNGELTERGLARLVGISQPHMHNVLKGQRVLSPQLADQILKQLHISVLDLIDRALLQQYLSSGATEISERVYLPVLKGLLGPGHEWPTAIDAHQRFSVDFKQLAGISGAVVVRLGDDFRMKGAFSGGEYVLLDQSLTARTVIDPDALYVVRRGDLAAVRRLRTSGRNVFMVTEDCLDRPAAWERIASDRQQIHHIVRARATLLTKSTEWEN
jgi:hypothetical protein